ncbi:hypothetical protein FB550_12023 [Neobacillus bataviensis]|uniref:Uncharacterized protein n=1 Tax=Neobacillus bataviensis TaxID=220685 RepID=A0A561CLW0_9BACI|nr:hypothetical protein FB550_12023 [Neobacillus bataviensis]
MFLILPYRKVVISNSEAYAFQFLERYTLSREINHKNHLKLQKTPSNFTFGGVFDV